LKEQIKEVLEKNKQKIINLSDEIWKFAEVGFKEFKSSELYVELLEEEGFKVEKGIAGMPTGFKAVYGHGKPVIGLLAEYDALPGLSQKAGQTKKERDLTQLDGAGHGCGHNGIGAGVFAAALAVKEYLKGNEDKGTVIVFGCPSEEKGDGKTIMAREGCFNGIDTAFTWHPGNINMIWNMGTLANISVYFSFTGKTAHAAMNPEEGRSGLDAVELMNVGANYLREHIPSDARIHYAYIDVGGNAPNVVQDYAKVHYFIRSPKAKQVLEIYERVQDIAKGAALMTGTESKCELYAGLSDFIPNATMSQVLYESVCEMGLPEFSEEDFKLAYEFFHNTYTEEIVDRNKQELIKKYGSEKGQEKIKRPIDTEILPFEISDKIMSGSTDVGDVSYVVPTAQILLSPFAFNTVLHTWQATAQMNTEAAHKVILSAGAAMAMAVIKVFEQPELCKKAKEELLTATNGEYICPIPKEIGPQLEG